jgi:hypothetical protein
VYIQTYIHIHIHILYIHTLCESSIVSNSVDPDRKNPTIKTGTLDLTPIPDDNDDVYLNKLQRKVSQNLWSEYMNNADQPIWHK